MQKENQNYAQKQKQKSKIWQNPKLCQKSKPCRSGNQNYAQKQKQKSKLWQNPKLCQKSKPRGRIPPTGAA